MVDRIRALANAKGLSLTNLERAVGLGNGTIGKWKKQSPSCDKAKLVADYLETTIDYLLTGKETPDSSISYPTVLTENEREMLDYFRALPEREQLKVIVRLEDMVKGDEAWSSLFRSVQGHHPGVPASVDSLMTRKG